MSRDLQEAGAGWLRGKHVLLAEDNLTNQMVASQMLEALGAGVEIANDGAEALDMLSDRFDLFLIDIEMPRVSGLDVIRAIRDAAAPVRDAPVIAVTAYALREHREKIEEAGADGLIPKPLISIEQFGRDIFAYSDRARGALAARRRAPPAMRAAEPAPVVEETYRALADALGPASLADLLARIDEDLAKAGAAVDRGSRDEDDEAVAAATHVVISVAGSVGGDAASVAARRLNEAAHGLGARRVVELTPTLLNEIGRLRRALDARRERLVAS